MRIVSGKFAGRIIKTPQDHRIHPMSEKIRAAIFSALGEITGLEVADLYAGSGAIGLEALSRGANLVVCVERSKGGVNIIKQNLNTLNIPSSDCRVLQQSVSGWVNSQTNQYNIIFADPPYDKTNQQVLQKLPELLKPSGLIVLSWPGQLTLPAITNMQLLRHKSYGDAQVGYYRLMEAISR